MLAVINEASRGAWWPDGWVGRTWVLIGLGGQAAFFSRFLVQWMASEVKQRSHIPVVFWYISLLAGVLLFCYSFFWKHDLPIAFGQVVCLVVYVRNIMLLQKEKAGQALPGGG